LALFLLTLRWAWVSPTIQARQCRLAQNAAWISVDWTSEPVDANAVTQLAEQAAQLHLRYLFPFTTYVKADGTWVHL
jgi:hypothetical protein